MTCSEYEKLDSKSRKIYIEKLKKEMRDLSISIEDLEAKYGYMEDELHELEKLSNN